MKKFIKAVPGQKHSIIYTDVVGRHYRFFGGTWAWRNHNPGNIDAGSISERHHQIGVAPPFAIFPSDGAGHDALIDVLITNYNNQSIHDMIYAFAPPKENPTAYYEKLLRAATGIYDNRPLKKLTPVQFRKLWQAIQKMEGYKVGKIVEVYRIVKVEPIDAHLYQYYLESGKVLTHKTCIALARKMQVELEICNSDLGKTFLRTPPNSLFQKRLEDLKK